MISRYSLYKISKTESLSFSKIDYSKFKFGDGHVAEKFGIDLAKKFIEEELSKNYLGTQLVVVSSPYSFIPTATFFLKNHFVYELNKWLAINNYPVVQETKIHRSSSYCEDYGMLNATERMELIGNDTFHIDGTFIKDKLLIFIDDIRITGTHEKMITKMLSTLNITNDYYLLYFAELVNSLIPPDFESELNYAFVKSIFNLDEILSESKFSINTRVVKFILNSDHDAFKIFIEGKNIDLKNLIYHMALGNSYHKIESYKRNFVYLQEIFNFEQTKITDNGN